ncbi:MAG: WhiB family transcriptional regulator [Acidimicrobiia bacterium]|nr:WhiB family transcriptional regulator [Gemmatimonadota bacterium]NNC39412.1 WhiB family transcriptional regulator [Acidimicrobiia bacterium]NNK48007.1 WhiB family transcriptional regulator [Gemmatimonadota bacterium]
MIKGDTLLDLSQEWREFAACSDRTDDLFFPSSESDISMVRAAKAVCLSCPVQEECLQYSLDTGQTEGVWGGLTSRERRVARRKRVAASRRAS